MFHDVIDFLSFSICLWNYLGYVTYLILYFVLIFLMERYFFLLFGCSDVGLLHILIVIKLKIKNLGLPEQSWPTFWDGFAWDESSSVDSWVSDNPAITIIWLFSRVKVLWIELSGRIGIIASFDV